MFLRIEHCLYSSCFVVVSEVQPTSEDGPTLKTKQTKSKKAEVDFDFTNSLEKNLLNIFAPPKNPKTLLLPESRPSCNTKLPEDCHYQPEELIKLFLLPDVKVVSLRHRNQFQSTFLSVVIFIYIYL
jgi:condensin complex subunit 2